MRTTKKKLLNALYTPFCNIFIALKEVSNLHMISNIIVLLLEDVDEGVDL